ncbi:MAG: hypothetical protein SynsKO_45500 [Synoicihabitans sp.]
MLARLLLVFGSALLLGEPGYAQMTSLAPAKMIPAQPNTDSIRDAYQNELERGVAAKANDFSPHFEAAVTLRQQWDDLSHPAASIAVYQDLAELAQSRDKTVAANTFINYALRVAEQLEDATSLMNLHASRAEIIKDLNRPSDALSHLKIVWLIAEQLDDHDAQFAAGMELARLLRKMAKTEQAMQILTQLRELSGIDTLSVELAIATTMPSEDFEVQREQLIRILSAAESQKNHPIIAQTLDRLGALTTRMGEPVIALKHFAAGVTLQPERRRNSSDVLLHRDALLQLQRPDQARTLLRQTVRQMEADSAHTPAAEIYAALAELEFPDNPTAAYQSMRRAAKLWGDPQYRPDFFAFRAFTPTNPTSNDDQAAALAAIRHELREAELDRTRLRQRQALGAAALAVFAAALLGLGYAYKRRAARVAALARDSAEVRAENAHLLALHYQLNPHFLFNALNSLRSRIFADQDQAAGLVDRLTAFCRQTLTSRPEGIETVGDECAMLQDYLAIEQSRWRENLQVNLDFDPDSFDRRLPSFLLLPLIENALKYGAETSEEQIEIAISIRNHDSDTIVATITNSGEWVVPGTANRRTSTRVGLTNLHERLERFYPERHELVVGADPAGGVTARLELRGDPVSLTTD